MIETPELIAALIVVAVALGVLVGVLTSWIAVDRFHKSARLKLEKWELELDGRSKNLDQITEFQLEDRRKIEDRDAIVTEKEQALRRGAKEAAAELDSAGTRFDTLPSLMAWPELPDPNQDADTVEEGR